MEGHVCNITYKRHILLKQQLKTKTYKQVNMLCFKHMSMHVHTHTHTHTHTHGGLSGYNEINACKHMRTLVS